MKYLQLALEGLVAGLIGGAIATALWLATIGHPPGIVAMLLTAQTVSSLWGLVRAVRFRSKWLAVIAAYEGPALGEGIDTPHRPPTDDQ